MLKSLCAVLIIVGTYLLSKSLFSYEAKQMLNLPFQKLPFYFKGIISLFGFRRSYKDKSLWEAEYFPDCNYFSLSSQFTILGPFIGFLLIVGGTLLSLLF